MEKDKEVKENPLLREVLIPVVSAVLIGGLSSYFTANAAIAVLKEKVNGIEGDISAISSIAKSVQMNQIELAGRGQWMQSTDARLSTVEEKLSKIDGTRYTKSDAERDLALLRLQLEASHPSKVKP